jgi:7-carboxy-7-deazaguanine synthase
MKINEIFFSIQGEGINSGKASIFLRLQGCNYRCKWCDTPYSWNMDDGKEMSIEKIIKKIQKYPIKRLTITGGEPMLQQEELKKLIHKLDDYEIEIETNGTIIPKINARNLRYNVSPKPPSAKILKNVDIKTLKKYLRLKSSFKFVISDNHDIDWVNNIISLVKIPTKKVILMPEGIDLNTIIKNSTHLIQYIKKYDYRLIPRLQIMIWGNQKGV